MYPTILLFRGSNGIISRVIRWQTDSIYAHAAIRINDAEIIESWPGKGVQRVAYTPHENIDEFGIPFMIKKEAERVIAFANAQVGQGYDYWGCLRFISRRNLPENERWFCSELVFAAFLAGGIGLLERIEAEQVGPGMLGYSPLLNKI